MDNITNWKILQTNNFDNRAHKSQCTHIFYSQTYYFLSWFQTIYTQLLIIFAKPPSINFSKYKSCSKSDLVFDGAAIFIHYKMINLDSITNENNKEHNENVHIFQIILTEF